MFAKIGLRDFNSKNGIRVGHESTADMGGPLSQVDWRLLAATVALCCFGLLSIFSATHIDAHSDNVSYVYLQKQLIGIGFAIPVFLFMWRLDYHTVLRRQWPIYCINLILLLLVLKLSPQAVNGAQRWINLGSFKLQPSEIAKLALIITLAEYLASRKNSLRDIKTVLLSLGHIAIPALVIFKQPDLGTALVLISIWLVMVFVAGVRLRHLAAIILVGVLAFSTLWVTGGIKQYQKDRFRVFLNPQADPQGMGYHIGQSLNAIGSGQLWGKGYLHSTQGQLGYIPEQRTDFIFTIVGEELGFVGSSILVFLYAVFLWRACQIAINAADTEGRLLSAGIAAMFLYHVVVNMGMTIGIMPVTGVPLPFMSYGGSSMMVSLAAVGLLQSIRAEQPRLLL